MAAKVTRRQLAILGGLPLVSAPGVDAQATPPADDDLSIQRENFRRNREQLAKVKLPIETEPAFTFKA